MQKQMNIGILMGGFSSERNVSLKSGKAVAGALSDAGYGISIIDFQNTDELIDKLSSIKLDCIFNALHGRFGEDGQVQKILDEFKIPYTGSGARTSALAMDKIASRRIFEINEITVPEYGIFNKKHRAGIPMGFELPLVIKPAHEGSSIGLSIVDSPAALFLALNEASAFDDDLLIEKYVRGRELTVGILDDKALPVIEIVPKNKFYDFQAKYTSGMTEYKVPADLPRDIEKAVKAAALKAHYLLGCRCFSRADIILNEENTPVLLEVNTIPGLTATSLLPKAASACGIGFEELCQKMISAALKSNKESVLY